MQRKPLPQGTVISFNGIAAEVLQDDGGDTLLVREEPGLKAECYWSRGGKSCHVIEYP